MAHHERRWHAADAVRPKGGGDRRLERAHVPRSQRGPAPHPATERGQPRLHVDLRPAVSFSGRRGFFFERGRPPLHADLDAVHAGGGERRVQPGEEGVQLRAREEEAGAEQRHRVPPHLRLMRSPEIGRDRPRSAEIARGRLRLDSLKVRRRPREDLLHLEPFGRSEGRGDATPDREWPRYRRDTPLRETRRRLGYLSPVAVQGVPGVHVPHAVPLLELPHEPRQRGAAGALRRLAARRGLELSVWSEGAELAAKVSLALVVLLLHCASSSG